MLQEGPIFPCGDGGGDRTGQYPHGVNDTTEHAGDRGVAEPTVPWWKATVPPWTTMLVLSGAALIGLIVGFSI